MNFRKGLLIVPAISLLVIAAMLLGILTQVSWDNVFANIFDGSAGPYFKRSFAGYSTILGMIWLVVIFAGLGGVAFWKAEKNLSKDDWFRIAHILAILLSAIIIAVSLHWKTSE